MGSRRTRAASSAAWPATVGGGKKTLPDEGRSVLTAATGALLDAGEEDPYAAAYERLRSCVIDGRGGPGQGHRAVGLGLLLQCGIPGWLRAGARIIGRPPGGRAFPGTPGLEDAEVTPLPVPLPGLVTNLAPGVLPPSQKPDLVRLIASLVLSTQHPHGIPGVLSVGGAWTSFPGGPSCR